MAGKPNRRTLALLAGVGLLSLCSGLALAQEQSKVRRTPVRGTLPFGGQELFTELCAACHGADGRGGGPATAALKMMPTDLTMLAKQAGGKFPSAEVRRFIEGADAVTAHGSREMPIWGQTFRSLSVDNPQANVELRIRNLTRYIESIQQK